MIGFGQNKFEIGIITGFSTDYSNHPLNNMIPVDKESGNSNSNLTGGINFKYNLSSRVSFSTYLTHKTYGNEFTFYHTLTGGVIGPGELISFHSKQKYIHAPLLLEYTVLNNKIRINLKSGFYYAHLIDEHHSIESDIIINFNNSSLGFFSDDFYKKSDYGIVFGAGASYSIDKLNILVDFHFNQGISDFSSEEWKDFLQNYEGKDNNMSLSTIFGITYNI